jgi:hypothetical protein
MDQSERILKKARTMWPDAMIVGPRPRTFASPTDEEIVGIYEPMRVAAEELVTKLFVSVYAHDSALDTLEAAVDAIINANTRKRANDEKSRALDRVRSVMSENECSSSCGECLFCQLSEVL